MAGDWKLTPKLVPWVLVLLSVTLAGGQQGDVTSNLSLMIFIHRFQMDHSAMNG